MSLNSWGILRSCLSEGRQPLATEIEIVAAQIWNDGGRAAKEFPWDSVKAGSKCHARTMALAGLALHGCPETALER
jgi:hypothetical protein